MGKSKAKKSNLTAQVNTIKSAHNPTNTSVSDLTFPPLRAKVTLTLHELLPSQIYLIPDFLTPRECTTLIDFIGANISLEHCSPIPKRGEAVRTNDRISFTHPTFADQLWKGIGLAGLVQDWIETGTRTRRATALNSNIRIYRYMIAQKFEPHYDDTVKDPLDSTLTSEFTLLIYLTGEEDGLVGGETVFYKNEKKKEEDAIVIKPQRGLALLHRHGAKCLLHEAKSVIDGVKWVVRSDLMFA